MNQTVPMRSFMPLPKNHNRVAQCDGKASFDSWSLANSIAQRRSRVGKKSDPYRCPFCRKFHLGR